jgi:hypothetical protein
MAFFGKSEVELKRIAGDLDNRQTDLDNRDADIKGKETKLAHERTIIDIDKVKFEIERSNHTEEFSRNAVSIAADKADLEKRRSEIAMLEAKAKANFADAQREAFIEVVEKRQAELDARQMVLDSLAADLAKRIEAFHGTEGDIAMRELAVTEREQKADAGFADKAKSLANEATRQHQANQAESDRLERLATQLAADRKAFLEKKAELTRREQNVLFAEHTRDSGFAEERANLNAELRDKRFKMEMEIANAREKNLSALEDQIAKLKTARLDDVSKAEQSERDRIRDEIAKDREAFANRQEYAFNQLENERTEFQKQKGAVSALQCELEGRKLELQANELMHERKELRLEQKLQKRYVELEESFAARFDDRRKSLELAEASSKAEISRLRQSLLNQTELLGVFEHLNRQFGGKDAAQILLDLNTKTDELKRLRQELATRPTEEMRERYKAIESEVQTQKARADKLAQQIADNNADVKEVADLRRTNSELNAENKSLAQKASRFEDSANQAEAELKRLRAAYESPAEVKDRHNEIEMPYIKPDKVKPPLKADVDEMRWLTGIGNACDSYGLHFNPRILKAFHTALKTAEWSPLTVLAGVSGTGKSELPRLYSHFGGIYFTPLSVQPNWDSQESMLGFFNSIDNKFDAQPVLNFLAQSQKSWSEDYPGLSNAVCLVLLDEMNLAHPELYFAEFLSKLELRRGMKGAEVPSLPIKIGAGMTAYQLPLGRNVLWTGTMNQDETTKSLSDKVLDRSIIINFPRPTELKRRQKLTPLDDKNRGQLLHKTSWQGWLAQGSNFSEEEVNPYKCFIEEMNASLAVSGRAIGHRVWQSVEYYMANYPDVRAAQQASEKDAFAKAMHIAFEDQLVQKVMPKLRGIDTRGKSKTECLDKIRGQIVAGVGGKRFNLAEDFDLACELGYGQFIWQSANYLRDSDAETQVLVATSAAGTTNGESTAQVQPTDMSVNQTADMDLSHPPSSFKPDIDSTERVQSWSRLSDKAKRMFCESDRRKST